MKQKIGNFTTIFSKDKSKCFIKFGNTNFAVITFNKVKVFPQIKSTYFTPSEMRNLSDIIQISHGFLELPF